MTDRKTPPPASKDPPPAGPHDKPGLTDEQKTPGTGALPKPGEKNQGSTTG